MTLKYSYMILTVASCNIYFNTDSCIDKQNLLKYVHEKLHTTFIVPNCVHEPT
jgi:hypothetical protein